MNFFTEVLAVTFIVVALVILMAVAKKEGLKQ